MKLLIAEDRMPKLNDIKHTIASYYQGNIEIDNASNYFSARNLIVSKKDYFMLIIDMFLPDSEDDDELRGLAGKDLIFDLNEENIHIPTLVITQYTEYVNSTPSKFHAQSVIPKNQLMENPYFGKKNTKEERSTFDCTYFNGLHDYLCSEIPFYLGILYYSNQFRNWEKGLLYFINKITKDEKYENTTI